MRRAGELRIGQNELTAFVAIEITANSARRPGEAKVELVKSPAQPLETEPEFDSLSIDYERPRACEECVFYFWPVYSFSGGELLRSPEVFQRPWIGYQHRETVWSSISINNGVDQRRAELAPSFVTRRCTSETRDKLLLQRRSNSGKIHTRSHCCAITGSKRDGEPPEGKIRRSSVNEQ